MSNIHRQKFYYMVYKDNGKLWTQFIASFAASCDAESDILFNAQLVRGGTLIFPVLRYLQKKNIELEFCS